MQTEQTPVNGLMQKMKNRRVSIWRLPDGAWMIDCKRLGDGRREIIKTRLKLSDEAMQAVAGMYLQFRGPLA